MAFNLTLPFYKKWPRRMTDKLLRKFKKPQAFEKRNSITKREKAQESPGPFDSRDL
jgi:hypothetical protein